MISRFWTNEWDIFLDQPMESNAAASGFPVGTSHFVCGIAGFFFWQPLNMLNIYIYIYVCVGSHRALFLEKNAHFHYQGGFWHADKNQWTIDSKHHTKCAWKLCFSSFHPHIFLVSFLDQSISVVQKSGGTSFVQLCFTRKNADGRMMVGFSQLRKIPERSWGKISGEWSIFHLEASKSWWSCW